jgi:hypothetical protein
MSCSGNGGYLGQDTAVALVRIEWVGQDTVGILIKTQWVSWSGHSGYVGQDTVHIFFVQDIVGKLFSRPWVPDQDTVGKMVRTVGTLVILHSVPWSGYSGHLGQDTVDVLIRIQWFLCQDTVCT